MTTAVKPRGGAMALLGKMAGAAPAKKKASDKPVIEASDLQPNADKIRNLRSQIEGLEGQLTPIEDQFSKAAAIKRVEWCRANGKLESSVKICGLTFSQKCQYSPVPLDREEPLRKVFGDSFDDYFKTTLGVELTAEAAADEGFLEKFVDLMTQAFGEEEFGKRFNVKRSIKVSESFHADFTLKPAVEKKAREFVDSEVIKAYKPTLKD